MNNETIKQMQDSYSGNWSKPQQETIARVYYNEAKRRLSAKGNRKGALRVADEVLAELRADFPRNQFRLNGLVAYYDRLVYVNRYALRLAKYDAAEANRLAGR